MTMRRTFLFATFLTVAAFALLPAAPAWAGANIIVLGTDGGAGSERRR